MILSKLWVKFSGIIEILTNPGEVLFKSMPKDEVEQGVSTEAQARSMFRSYKKHTENLNKIYKTHAKILKHEQRNVRALASPELEIKKELEEIQNTKEISRSEHIEFAKKIDGLRIKIVANLYSYDHTNSLSCIRHFIALSNDIFSVYHQSKAPYYEIHDIEDILERGIYNYAALCKNASLPLTQVIASIVELFSNMYNCDLKFHLINAFYPLLKDKGMSMLKDAFLISNEYIITKSDALLDIAHCQNNMEDYIKACHLEGALRVHGSRNVVLNNIEDYTKLCSLEETLLSHSHRKIVHMFWKQKKYAAALKWIEDNYDLCNDSFLRLVKNIFKEWGYNKKANKERLKWFKKTLYSGLYEGMIDSKNIFVRLILKQQLYEIAHNHEDPDLAFSFFASIKEYRELIKFIYAKHDKIKDTLIYAKYEEMNDTFSPMMDHHPSVAKVDSVAGQLLMNMMNELRYQELCELKAA